jgi:hypothetical protein
MFRAKPVGGELREDDVCLAYLFQLGLAVCVLRQVNDKGILQFQVGNQLSENLSNRTRLTIGNNLYAHIQSP